MIRFYFNKLVRDKIVQNCLDDPKVIVTKYHQLNDDDYFKALQSKVSEEVAEVPNQKRSHEALGELADLQSAIDSLRELLRFSEAEVRDAVIQKDSKKGGFLERHYIEYVDLSDDSEWIHVFREQPDKYREERL